MGPTFLLAERPSASQEIFIWVTDAACVIGDDDGRFGIADEVSIFVVYKNELRARVREDVVDLVLGQADVDSRDNRTRADDPLQCLYDKIHVSHAGGATDTPRGRSHRRSSVYDR